MTTHKTAFLVGSGALTDAWSPVIAALRSVGFHDVSSSSGATFAMAHLVYMARLAHIRSQARIGQSAKEICDKLAEARRAIATALNAAEEASSLSVQSEFDDVFDSLVCRRSDSIYMITTNWDGSVERAAKRRLPEIETLYLHGRASEPDRLYLPSEIVEEPYRSETERIYLNNARAHAVRAIGEATRIVIYGLSVSALDAELGGVLFAGAHASGVKEVHVIDPCHCEVVERLATLGPLGTLQIPIYARKPSSLSTIRRFPSA